MLLGQMLCITRLRCSRSSPDWVPCTALLCKGGFQRPATAVRLAAGSSCAACAPVCCLFLIKPEQRPPFKQRPNGSPRVRRAASEAMAAYFPDYHDPQLRLPAYWAKCELRGAEDPAAARAVWEATLKSVSGRCDCPVSRRGSHGFRVVEATLQSVSVC